MVPIGERVFDPALTWAGLLASSLPSQSRDAIQRQWESPEGLTHRAVLKEHLPDLLQQLVDEIRARLSQLPKEQAA